MYTDELIDNAAFGWMTSKRFTADAATNAKIRQRVQDNLERLGGYPAISSFEIAYLQLSNEGAVQPFRGTVAEQPAAAPVIPADVLAFIEDPNTPVAELRRRYRADATFRRYYDLHEKMQRQPDQQTGVVSLTVAEYHAIPSALIAQKYQRDFPRGFRAAVDRLISEGKI